MSSIKPGPFKVKVERQTRAASMIIDNAQPMGGDNMEEVVVGDAGFILPEMVLRGALEDACVQRGTSYETSWVSEERVEFGRAKLQRGTNENPIMFHDKPHKFRGSIVAFSISKSV